MFPGRSLESRRREDSEGVGGKVVRVKGMEMGERESQDLGGFRRVGRFGNGTKVARASGAKVACPRARREPRHVGEGPREAFEGTLDRI